MSSTNKNFRNVTLSYVRLEKGAMAASKTTPSAPLEIVNPNEFAAMMNAVSGKGQHDTRARCALACMFYAGMRRSELAGLSMEQVVFDGLPRLEVRGSKYGKGRNIPMDPRLVEHIRSWLATRSVDSTHLFCTYTAVGRNAVSPDPNPPGSPLSSSNPIWQHVQTAKRRAGITRRIRPHMFRHAAATMWLKQGLTVREVQYLLGHANIQTTQRYLHVHDEEIARKIQALGNGVSTIASRDGMKTCYYCAERIRAEARICRYCQHPCSDAA